MFTLLSPGISITVKTFSIPRIYFQVPLGHTLHSRVLWSESAEAIFLRGNNPSKFLTDAVQINDKILIVQLKRYESDFRPETEVELAKKDRHIAFPLAMDSASLIITNLYTKCS